MNVGPAPVEERPKERHRRFRRKERAEAKVPTRRGGKWSKWSVSLILHNPVYAGWLHWDGRLIAGIHEAVISAETFNAVQMKIVHHSKIRRKPEFLLPCVTDLEAGSSSSLPGHGIP